MRFLIIAALVLVTACQDDPTLAGGFTLDRDGRMFFTSDGQLYVTLDDAFTAHPAQVAPPGVFGPALSRNGRSLAWHEGATVVVLDRATGIRRTITPRDHSDRQPSWSPDGRTLMVLRQGPTDGRRLVLVEPWLETVTPLPETMPVPTGGFDWSAVRREVVLVRADPDHFHYDMVVRVAEADGSEVVMVPSDTGVLYSQPRWSPDGSRFVVMHRDLEDDFGIGHMMVFGRDGTELARLQVTWGQSPGWSPDGQRVVFCQEVASESTYRNEIRIWDIAAGTTRTLTPLHRSDCEPTWGQ